MKTDTPLLVDSTLAETVAGEDLRCGDYVTTFSQTYEFPSFFWDRCDYSIDPAEVVRLRFTAPDSGDPLKVIGICLPFIYVIHPDRSLFTLDLRKTQLVRLDAKCAKRIWKALRRRLAPIR